jgi:hypothetical protein
MPQPLQQGPQNVSVTLNREDQFGKGSPNLVFTYYQLAGTLSPSLYGSNDGGTMITLVVDGGKARWNAGSLQGAFSECATEDVSNCTDGDHVLSNVLMDTPSAGMMSCTTPATAMNGTVSLKLTSNNRATFAAEPQKGELKFTFHPRVSFSTNWSPRSGPTSGDTVVTITGAAFPLDTFSTLQTPKCKITPLRSSLSPSVISANVLDHKTITCAMPPTQVSDSQLSVSFNAVDFHQLDGKFSFQSCSPGSYSPSYLRPCMACPLAMFQGARGGKLCDECSELQFANSTASTSCYDCPRNTVIEGNATNRNDIVNCDCKKKYFLPSNDSDLSFVTTEGGNITLQTSLRGRECVVCPSQAMCGGASFQPIPKRGFWCNMSFDPAVILDCPQPSSCTGSIRPCLPDEKCGAINYTLCGLGSRGKQCGLCSKGFYKDNTNCLKCSENNDRFWVVVGVMTGVSISGALFAVKVLKRKPPGALLAPASIGLAFWQTISLFKRIDLNWPTSLRTVLDIVGLFNANIDYWQADCSFDLDYHTKMVAVVALPFAVCFTASSSLLLVAVVLQKGE